MTITTKSNHQNLNTINNLLTYIYIIFINNIFIELNNIRKNYFSIKLIKKRMKEMKKQISLN